MPWLILALELHKWGKVPHLLFLVLFVWRQVYPAKMWKTRQGFVMGGKFMIRCNKSFSLKEKKSWWSILHFLSFILMHFYIFNLFSHFYIFTLNLFIHNSPLPDDSNALLYDRCMFHGLEPLISNVNIPIIAIPSSSLHHQHQQGIGSISSASCVSVILCMKRQHPVCAWYVGAWYWQYFPENVLLKLQQSSTFHQMCTNIVFAAYMLWERRIIWNRIRFNDWMGLTSSPGIPGTRYSASPSTHLHPGIEARVEGEQGPKCWDIPRCIQAKAKGHFKTG